jgi:hypothetical protein
MTVTHCLLQHVYPGMTFCFMSDPLFVNPDAMDFHVSQESDAIDSGKNSALPPNILTELDGNPRFIDDPNTDDCPLPGADCGDPPIVDMGCYEFVGGTPILAACCFDDGACQDLTLDDCTNAGGVWEGYPTECATFECPTPPCPADINGDGWVNVDDLFEVLGNWGQCP